MLLRLLEYLNASNDTALERYLRDENLPVELDRRRAQSLDRRLETLERNLYAASSYFAA